MNQVAMKNTENRCSNCTCCIKLPQDLRLRQWVDCDECWHGEYVPSQGAYWCRKFGGYDPRGGCAKGDPR